MDDAGYRQPGPAPRVFESVAGIDTLHRHGDRVIVFSPEPMPDWRVGRYRRTAIHVRGERYAVAEVRRSVGGHEYVLEPWPSRPNELASQEIVYDEGYVRSRQEDAEEIRRRRKQAWVIAPVWPLLGFLPRWLKTKLHHRYGFEPIGGTRLSVMLELVALVFLCIFTIVRAVAGVDWLTMTIGGGGELRDLLLIIAIVTDLTLRASILYDDAYAPYGFWEWVVHPDLKVHARRISEAFQEWRRARAERDE